MASIVDTETKLVVEGLTGSEGRFHGPFAIVRTARTSSPA